MKKAYPKILRIFLSNLQSNFYYFENLKKVDINSCVCCGDTLLNKAAHYGDLRVVRALLKHGADPKAEGEDLYTPLHKAASRGHLKIVRLLLEHGASAEATNIGRRTPLDLAKMNNHSEVVRLLTPSGSSQQILS